MSKRRTRTKLGLVLVVCTVVSFALSVGAFFLLNSASGALIDNVIYNKEKILSAEKNLFNEFLAFMNDKKARITDSEVIKEWLSDKKHVMLAVYDAQNAYLRADAEGVLYANQKDPLSMYGLLQQRYSDYWYSCPVRSSGDMMRSRVVKVMYFPMYNAENIAVFANAALSFALFVLIEFLCIHGKMKYIALLSRELQAMQGGDLMRPVTVKGNDEITSLAMDMDCMRLSFIERLQKEEMLSRSSSELLTAMSHDLRTPLTSLIGYLDILDLGKCASREQELKYIHSGKLKAYQIKEMTDKLFEYFLVYSPDEEKMETEPMDAGLMFSQLWAESSLILETEGYTLSVSESGREAIVNANVPMMRRVMDNIVSNIKKYASKAEPIVVNMYTGEDTFVFEASNGKGEALPRAESSGIGLKTCDKIMKLHGGAFAAEDSEERFLARLTIPLRAGEMDALTE